jgi:hypothetical protein
MPIKYVILGVSGNHKDAKPTKVLAARSIKLEKL